MSVCLFVLMHIHSFVAIDLKFGREMGIDPFQVVGYFSQLYLAGAVAIQGVH